MEAKSTRSKALGQAYVAKVPFSFDESGKARPSTINRANNNKGKTNSNQEGDAPESPNWGSRQWVSQPSIKNGKNHPVAISLRGSQWSRRIQNRPTRKSNSVQSAAESAACVLNSPSDSWKWTCVIRSPWKK